MISFALKKKTDSGSSLEHRSKSRKMYLGDVIIWSRADDSGEWEDNNRFGEVIILRQKLQNLEISNHGWAGRRGKNQRVNSVLLSLRY